MGGSVNKRILFLGHSQVAFCDWKRVFTEYEVSAFGVPGETVEALLERTKGIVKEHPAPDFVFVLAGLNNVVVDDFGFLEPYRKVIKAIQQAYPGSRAYACSIPPVMKGLVPLDTIIRANAAIKTIARENNAGFLDLHGLLVNETGDGEGCFMADGVHLNDKGYAVWAEAVRETIEGWYND